MRRTLVEAVTKVVTILNPLFHVNQGFLFKSSFSCLFVFQLASIFLVKPLFKPPFQVKAAIVVKTNSIMIDKTDLKNRIDRIGTTGKRDMGDSMIGLTNNSLHKRLTNIKQA